MALAARLAVGAGQVCSARPARRAPQAARASSAAAPLPQAGAAEAQPVAGLALSRRGLLGSAAAAAAVAVSGAGTMVGANWAAPPAAEAVELAPLGPVERVGGDKLVGLTPDQVKVRWNCAVGQLVVVQRAVGQLVVGQLVVGQRAVGQRVVVRLVVVQPAGCACKLGAHKSHGAGDAVAAEAATCTVGFVCPVPGHPNSPVTTQLQ